MGWDSETKYYVYTNAIINVGGTEAPDLYFKNAKLPAWELKYCLDNDKSRFQWADTTQAITNLKSYLSNGAPLVRQPIFDNSLDGEEYSEYKYAWGTQADVEDDDYIDFIYSKTEVIKTGDTVFNYYNYELQTADVLDFGKGVIYYMRDEFANECPYDFKNIQFIRTLDEDGNLDKENGTDTWCYTFGGAQCDRSIPQEGMKEYNNNSIGSRYMGCDENYWLPDNVFLGIDECMTKCNRLGNNCFDNTFGNKAQYNTLGDDCYSNTFGANCSGNTLGIKCNAISFGSGCGSNIIGQYCNTITIVGDSIWYIEVESCISRVQINPEPDANYHQIYRKSDSKEILI